MTADANLGRTFGDVTITDFLGRGSMGVVYRGKLRSDGRTVAVKLLNAEHTGNALQRFLRECKTAARIRHGNVVQVVDSGEVDAQLYLVLELVQGEDLGKRIAARGRIAIADMALLGEGSARGLAAIHAVGIVHRDIKPDNILLDGAGTAKITDLGLSKVLDDPDQIKLTTTGFLVGTPLYVAPENISNPKVITAAVDVYGLGATLYHAVAGRPPFNVTNIYELMRSHLDEQPPRLEELRAEIPPWMALAIHHCLDKNPEARPTAAGLADIFARQGVPEPAPVAAMPAPAPGSPAKAAEPARPAPARSADTAPAHPAAPGTAMTGHGAVAPSRDPVLIGLRIAMGVVIAVLVLAVLLWLVRVLL